MNAMYCDGTTFGFSKDHNEGAAARPPALLAMRYVHVQLQFKDSFCSGEAQGQNTIC